MAVGRLLLFGGSLLLICVATLSSAATDSRYVEEMEEYVMHPIRRHRPPSRRVSVKVDDGAAPALRRDSASFRHIEVDDDDMHPRINYRKTRASRSQRKSDEDAIEGLDDHAMHPRMKPKMEMPRPDEAVDFGINDVLGADFLRRVEMFDDSILHDTVDEKAKIGKSPYKKSSEKWDIDHMHPIVSHNHDASKGDVDLGDDNVDEDGLQEAALGPNYPQDFEMDDTEMHPTLTKKKEVKGSHGSGRRLLSKEDSGSFEDNRDDSDDHSRKVKSREDSDESGDSTHGSYHFKFGYPVHASCKISWTFGVNCTSVSESLVSQIKEWNGPDNCDGGGEKCLYELISVNKTMLTGTHTTPKKGYVDDISFQFTPDGTSCKVFGFSTSQTWYAVLDSGTNYCNLHNLITGSELDKVAGYEETTSDSKCTQYSSADCDVY